MPLLISPARARQLMHAHKPRGWSIKMGGAQRRGASGLCDWDSRTIYVPLVCDDYSLMVYLHEVGHAKLRHKDSKAPSHVIEYEAEMYAHAALRACGFWVSREITRTAKNYVSDEIKKDRIQGIPIYPKIERWATRKSRSRVG